MRELFDSLGNGGSAAAKTLKYSNSRFIEPPAVAFHNKIRITGNLYRGLVWQGEKFVALILLRCLKHPFLNIKWMISIRGNVNMTQIRQHYSNNRQMCRVVLGSNEINVLICPHGNSTDEASFGKLSCWPPIIFRDLVKVKNNIYVSRDAK